MSKTPDEVVPHEMKKEYVIKSIDSSADDSPYVTISLASSKDLKESRSAPQSPFGARVMEFSNMGDMMKDLNKALSGNQGTLTSIKLEIHEYKKMGLSVGDRVYLTMSKAETLGV